MLIRAARNLLEEHNKTKRPRGQRNLVKPIRESPALTRFNFISLRICTRIPMRNPGKTPAAKPSFWSVLSNSVLSLGRYDWTFRFLLRYPRHDICGRFLSCFSICDLSILNWFSFMVSIINNTYTQTLCRICCLRLPLKTFMSLWLHGFQELISKVGRWR